MEVLEKVSQANTVEDVPPHAADKLNSTSSLMNATDTNHKNRLDNNEILRYSRQLILPEFGVNGQVALRDASVLIVGCGGLGCPVAIYLTGAGVGRIGLIDYDVVELSNLHRQVQHAELSADRAASKADSLADSCKRLNTRVVCDVHNVVLNSTNAIEIVSQYCVVVDATDNVASRYLLNDACVFTGRPLVSGSALRFEGQLTVYNYKDSPCYRCVFPVPPPPATITNCSDGGVFGPVVGVIGSMQAMEVLKIVSGIGEPYAGRLMLYDGLEGAVRVIRLRAKKRDCSVCGETPTITSLIDYEEFCGSSATDKTRGLNILSKSERISAVDYADIVNHKEPHFLVDVRTPVELEICKLPSTTHNVPMTEFDKADGYGLLLDKFRSEVTQQAYDGHKPNVFVVCRRGNDSQVAVEKLRSVFADISVDLKDIKGGLHAWSSHVDTDFPKY